MSSSDMWQLKQPASETVAMRGLGCCSSVVFIGILRGLRWPGICVKGDQRRLWPMGTAKPRRLGRMAPTGQMLRCMVVCSQGAVAQQAGRAD